jgi:hypothetical protein
MDKVDVLMELSAYGRDDLCQWAYDNLQEPEWIKCEDLMPEYGERVLCSTKRNGLKILRYCISGPGAYKPGCVDWQGEVVSAIGQRFDVGEVTHWMLLPEPPNAKVSGAGTPSAGLPGWASLNR